MPAVPVEDQLDAVQQPPEPTAETVAQLKSDPAPTQCTVTKETLDAEQALMPADAGGVPPPKGTLLFYLLYFFLSYYTDPKRILEG